MKRIFKTIFITVLIIAFSSCTYQPQETTTTHKEILPPPELTPIETIDLDQWYSDMEKWNTEKVYTITYSAWIDYNNHVGNSWGYGLSYDGEYIESGSAVTCQGFMSTIPPVKVYAVEHDSIDDYGSASVSFDSLDVGEDQTKSVSVIVRENRGRYSGNTAKWIFEVTVERIS